MATRAPKQWSLAKTETINLFDSWKNNLQYGLSLDKNFAPFLVDGFSWGKQTRAEALRGFEDDGEDVDEDKRKTAQQKVTLLNLMLGQIANFCPIVSRNSIIRNSKFIADVWQTI